MRASALASLFLAAAALTAHAQQYRWIDEKGRVQYSDTLPPASAKSVEKKDFRGNAVGQQPGYELSRAVREAPVRLYTHPICKEACEFARQLLKRRGVPFSEVVATEQATMQELKNLSGGDTVPVLVVGSEVERTASPEAYNRALDIAGYPR
jgi:glutaredoxin